MKEIKIAQAIFRDSTQINHQPMMSCNAKKTGYDMTFQADAQMLEIKWQGGIKLLPMATIKDMDVDMAFYEQKKIKS